MRHRMIFETKPGAMVVIGGMEGIFEEVKMFGDYCREMQRPVNRSLFVAESTGGAARQLVHQRGETESLRWIERDWAKGHATGYVARDAPDPRDFAIPPYAAMMQWLVSEMAGL